ncbi:UDP-glucose 4-epimerase [BD1-7 clade bacterium]|uniref:UDP-glucose 4-epimerase n=1 Tax=BD1-7 clade bacterium TaxID=2029982 RepID=A0A5S9PKZ5_9GAMM|nr:UDP-glucose 4-epimerase [BD1-7 clade bacterium]CAA0105014.1 UDP-glucose 4-epimerase [BD1-7 clade bacterium]
MSKSVLLTGAFGNLGCYVLDALLKKGYQVTCFDLASKPAQEAAKRFEGHVEEIVWGDIRDQALMASLLVKKDAVIHLAALIPPATDDMPKLAWEVNVDATKQLLEAIQKLNTSPVFIFTSSFTVFGEQTVDSTVKKASDPVAPMDNYTEQKVACEAAIVEHTKPWMIFRVGVSIDADIKIADKRLVRQMFDTRADNCLEYIHPRDVALALANGVEREEAWHRIHLGGGGKSCQVRQRDLVATIMGAAGFTFADSEMGKSNYYTHWMDTELSQEILEFQTTSWADFEADIQHKFRFIKPFVKPIQWIAKPAFRAFFGIPNYAKR